MSTCKNKKTVHNLNRQNNLLALLLISLSNLWSLHQFENVTKLEWKDSLFQIDPLVACQLLMSCFCTDVRLTVHRSAAKITTDKCHKGHIDQRKSECERNPIFFKQVEAKWFNFFNLVDWTSKQVSKPNNSIQPNCTGTIQFARLSNMNVSARLRPHKTYRGEVCSHWERNMSGGFLISLSQSGQSQTFIIQKI